MSPRFPVSWALSLALAAVVPLTACAGPAEPPPSPQAIEPGVQAMIEQILVSGRPTGREQIDVHDIVLQHFPLGTDRTAIAAAFAHTHAARVVEDRPERLVVRADRGRAVIDPDARSVVIAFAFDRAGALASVEARHLRPQ